MDNYSRGLSAQGIGKQIGATSVEVNRLLKDQGFLYGEPGAYYLTAKGKTFGAQEVHDNGYGGYAYRSWETTHFDPSITEVLDSSPDRLAKVRDDILARKRELSAARNGAQAAADAHFQAFQARKVEGGVDPQKVWLVIAGIVVIAGAGYGVYKGVQWCKRDKAGQTDSGDGASS